MVVSKFSLPESGEWKTSILRREKRTGLNLGGSFATQTIRSLQAFFGGLCSFIDSWFFSGYEKKRQPTKVIWLIKNLEVRCQIILSLFFSLVSFSYAYVILAIIVDEECRVS